MVPGVTRLEKRLCIIGLSEEKQKHSAIFRPAALPSVLFASIE